MDPFVQYIIIINVVTFLVFAIDYFLCAKFPTLDDSTANSLILGVFPIAGGAVGMLIALFVFSGFISKHRVNKNNVAWWFLAIVCLVVWGLVIAIKTGFIPLDASIAGVFTGWDVGKLKILGIYLVIITVVTYIVFAWDKHVAEKGNDYKRRVPEAYLLGLCLVGGSIGGLVGMYVERHKTQKWYFVWGLPLFIVLDIVVVVIAHMAGVI